MSETKTEAPPVVPVVPEAFEPLALIEASVVVAKMGLVLLESQVQLTGCRVVPVPRDRVVVELVAASEADVLQIVRSMGLPRLITSSDVSERPLYWSGWVGGIEVRVPVAPGGVA